jgi:hypothetical protein
MYSSHLSADMCTAHARRRRFATTAWQARLGVAVRILLRVGTEDTMSLVRLLGFTTLRCGCVVGRYREVATSREVTYVEEKGKTCGSQGHRRNHTVAADRIASAVPIALATKAS